MAAQNTDYRLLGLVQGLSLFICHGTFFFQERKFVGGANQISECMARELGERVKLQSAVYSIDQTGDMVEVKTVNEETYKVSSLNSQPVAFKEPSTCAEVFIGDISLTLKIEPPIISITSIKGPYIFAGLSTYCCFIK